MNLEEKNFLVSQSETIDTTQEVASITSQEISSNSSFSTDIDFVNMGMNQIQITNRIIPIGDLINFESPKSSGPLCSSRVNSANRPAGLVSHFPECSPISRTMNGITGTISLTPRHSINQTDRTLRKRSLSFSRQERTISPTRQRSGPPSLCSSQLREDFTDSPIVPVNTPAFSLNSAKHSSGDSLRGIANDIRNRRINSSRNFHRHGRSAARFDDDIPFITHSNRKVSTWLNKQVPHNSRNSIQSLTSSSPDFPKTVNARDLTNFIVSDFESNRGSDHLSRSNNPCHQNTLRYNNYYPPECPEYYNQGFCLPGHPHVMADASFGSYNCYPDLGATPSHGMPSHNAYQNVTPHNAYQNVTPHRFYPPLNYNGYPQPIHLDFRPMYHLDHPPPLCPYNHACRVECTPTRNNNNNNTSRNSKKNKQPLRSHANGVQGSTRKIRKKSLKVGRFIKKRSRNQNVSNSSIIVETLAEI